MEQSQVDMSDVIIYASHAQLLVSFLLGAVLSYGYFYLFSEREYKEVNHQLFVKHGKFGKWENLAEHMKRESKG